MKTRGRLIHLRCGRVKDALKAEQRMHELIRKQVETNNDGNEWYQTDNEDYLIECFDKMMDEYGLEVDDMVVKYDMNERALLEDRLERISEYITKRDNIIGLTKDLYFIDVANKAIYKRSANDTLTKLNIRKDDFMMKDVYGKAITISLERLINQYNIEY